MPLFSCSTLPFCLRPTTGHIAGMSGGEAETYVASHGVARLFEELAAHLNSSNGQPHAAANDKVRAAIAAVNHARHAQKARIEAATRIEVTSSAGIHKHVPVQLTLARGSGGGEVRVVGPPGFPQLDSSGASDAAPIAVNLAEHAELLDSLAALATAGTLVEASGAAAAQVGGTVSLDGAPAFDIARVDDTGRLDKAAVAALKSFLDRVREIRQERAGKSTPHLVF